jgi:lipopolysaccharide/colanic/teichoic acid biosynthesis glycosyltransferase
VFITCKRVGLGHRVFDLYKLRTKPVKRDQVFQYDFGKFLESRGLNELPSLINVLKGDMSLVGCKPLQLNEVRKLTRDQMAVRLMTPVGFTGLWRIKARELSKNQQLHLEIEYAMKNSVWMDMRILFSTFTSKPLHQEA